LRNERRAVRLAFHKLYDGIFRVVPGERGVPLTELEDLKMMRTFRGTRVPLYERPPERVLIDHSRLGPDDAPGVRLFDERLFDASVAWVVRDANTLYRRYLQAIEAPQKTLSGHSRRRQYETAWFRLALLSAAAKRYGRSGLNFLRRKAVPRGAAPGPTISSTTSSSAALARVVRVAATLSEQPRLRRPPASLVDESRRVTSKTLTRSRDKSAETSLRALTAITAGLSPEQREDVYQQEKHILAVVGWDPDARGAASLAGGGDGRLSR
jgi:hypothetical protein